MSEIAFPVKDLARRKTQTTLTIVGLTLVTAATIFLVIFGANLGLEISYFAKEGRLTSGVTNILFHIILAITILNLLTGPIVTSLMIRLTMSERMRDIARNRKHLVLCSCER